MKYYIDKDDAVNVMYTFLKQAHDMDSNNDKLAELLTIAKNVVNAIPRADVAPVIRCKECVFGMADDSYCPSLYLCQHRWDDWNNWNNGEHFCSYGERKDDAII